MALASVDEGDLVEVAQVIVVVAVEVVGVLVLDVASVEVVAGVERQEVLSQLAFAF